jgi:hypothetical protein
VTRMRRRGTFTRLGIAGLLVVVAVGCSKKPPVDRNKEVFADFSKRVDTYATLQQHLADSVGPLDPKMSQNEIAGRSSKLANAIIAARQGAREGDIFTPEVSTIMATIIKEEYSRRPQRILETRGDAQQELKDEHPDFEPHVNQIYPTGAPLATFPASLLPLLPQLPKQVEYRIVTTNLLLRDIEANVIVDVMRNAVPQENLP